MHTTMHHKLQLFYSISFFILFNLIIISLYSFNKININNININYQNNINISYETNINNTYPKKSSISSQNAMKISYQGNRKKCRKIYELGMIRENMSAKTKEILSLLNKQKKEVSWLQTCIIFL